MYAIRILISQPLRLILTISGVSLCIVLMLFLISVYKGVEYGSLEYIRSNKTDLWVMQKNAWNIMRGISFFPERYGETLSDIAGIKSYSPIVLLLSGVTKDEPIASMYLVGYDPQKGVGGPPEIIEGRSVEKNNDIVIDKAFSIKHKYKIDDEIIVNGDKLKVCGISKGTNALVIQFAFTTLAKAQSMVGLPGIVSAYLIDTQKGANIRKISESIKSKLSNIEVFDYETFLANNRKEMETGFLPFIYSIAVLGTIVLTAILSLLLSINIIERRKDFAVIKTLGAPQGFLPILVIEQSVIIIVVSSVITLLAFYPVVYIIQNLSPEITVMFTFNNFTIIVLIGLIVSLLSSVISIKRLKGIYTMEAFS